MGALDGLLVVSLEQAVAAPLCTSQLSRGGARVIKIERDVGDFARGYDRAACGDSSYFAWLNQNKESLVADIKLEADVSLLHRIIAKADVFVQNLAPGATQRAGLGSAMLRKLNSRLITCDISGYGDNDAVQGLKAYDLLVQAESGLVSVSGPPGEYGRVGVSICDIGAGTTAYAAILEALLLREKTGCGQGLSVSLFDVAAEWLTVPFVHANYGKGAPERVGLKHPSIAPYGAFRTGDDQHVLLSVQNEREWARLCNIVLARPDLVFHPEFDSNDNRVMNRSKLDAIIQDIFGRAELDNIRDRLKSADLAFASINKVSDLGGHQAFRSETILTSQGETLQVPAHPVRQTGSVRSAPRRPPKIGEQSVSLRREFNS